MTFRFLHTAVAFELRSRREKFLQLQSAALNSDRDFLWGGNVVALLHLCSAVIRALLRPCKYPDRA